MNQIIEDIIVIVKECSKIILEAKRDDSMISAKDGYANFVTTYDKQVQAALKEKLLKILPDAFFVGEEDLEHKKIPAGYAFIVDPIDGTTNFIKDYKKSAISVGLVKDGVPTGGVVYNPYLDETFYAWKGEGAFLNGTPIHVSSQPLSNALVLFGTAPYYKEFSEPTFRMAFEYLQKCIDIRRGGSCALDLCDIASGRGEVFFEYRVSPWDHAAGALIVEEAGGKVTTLEGEPLSMNEPCSILASNVICHR